MFLWAVVLWVGGLVTIVPFAAYYLLFHAQRDEYAFLITLVLFWIFGFWGIVAPILTILKVRTVFRRIEQAQTQGNLREALRNKETEEVLVNLIGVTRAPPRVRDRTPSAATQDDRRAWVRARLRARRS